VVLRMIPQLWLLIPIFITGNNPRKRDCQNQYQVDGNTLGFVLGDKVFDIIYWIRTEVHKVVLLALFLGADYFLKIFVVTKSGDFGELVF